MTITLVAIAYLLPFVMCTVATAEFGLANFNTLKERIVVIAGASLDAILVILLCNGVYGLHFHLIALCAMFIPCLILSLILRRLPWQKHFFAFGMTSILGHIVIIILVALQTAFPDISWLVLLACGAVVTLSISLAVHFFFAKSFRMVMDGINEGWTSLSICAILSVLILFIIPASITVFSVDRDVLYLLVDLALSVVLALMFISIVIAMVHLNKESMSRQNLEVFREQFSNQRQLYEQREELQKEQRRKMHDQRHAIQTIIDELQANEVQLAITHLEEMRGEVPQSLTIYCKNQAINAAISLWARRAEDAGIAMRVRADAPEDLNVDDVDLSVIVGNLLENAYEGCMRVERTEAKRFISVRCSYDNGRLSFQVENACRNDIVFEDGMPQTQKRGGGIGTHSVLAKVKSLNGLCTFSKDDGVFISRVVFKA